MSSDTTSNSQLRPQDADELRDRVSEGYTRVAESAGLHDGHRVDDVGRRIGYSD